MVDPKLMEAWYRLMAEAVRAGGDVSKTMPNASKEAAGPPSEWLARWMQEQGLPGAPPPPDEMSDDWLEQWYQMMGVVPRQRYLKALERNERLREKLEEANRRIERLGGAAAASQSQEQAAEEMLNYWKQSMEETLDAQKRWMQSLRQDDEAPDSSDAASEDKEAD